MAVRSLMRHRCVTARRVSSGRRDGANHPVNSETPVLSHQPCYWQASREQFVANGEKMVGITSHLLLLPLGSDIHEQDWVTSVKSRRGKPLVTNRLRVLTVVPREDHLEAMLEEYD